MNKKIETMKEEIIRRGGIIHVSEKLPDEATERFLAEILDCPDCKAEAGLKGPRLDH